MYRNEELNECRETAGLELLCNTFWKCVFKVIQGHRRRNQSEDHKLFPV